MSSIEELFLSQVDVWVPLVASFLGGILALIGSLTATMHSNRNLRLARLEDKENTEAELAYGTLWKLLDGFNSASNLKRQINEMFDLAAENGAGDMEPWGKVTQFVGATDHIERISPSETAFLIKQKNSELLNEVHLVQQRLQTIMAAKEKYNHERAKFLDFLETNMVDGELDEGVKMGGSFGGSAMVRANLQGAILNNLLGQIMGNLETDLPRSWSAILAFRQAAVSRYEDRFPSFNLTDDTK